MRAQLMGRFRLLALGACLVGVVTMGGVVVPGAAGSLPGQVPTQRPTPTIDLQIASVSPWVTPDGEFQVRFEPSAEVPPDAELSITIHQAITGGSDTSIRQHLTKILDDESAGRILRTIGSQPVDILGDPASGAVLTIPIRSGRGDSERVFVPNAGVHPVELVLTSADGPELWRQTVFLNRLPATQDDEDAADPTSVALMVTVESAPSLTEVGSASFDDTDIAVLRQVSEQLDAADQPTLLVGVEPNTVDGLARTEATWARRLLAQLRGAAADALVLQRPYVRIDSGALVASGGADQFNRQVLFGRDRIRQHLGAMSATTIWAFDDTVTPAVLPLLPPLGVSTLIADSDSIETSPRITPSTLTSTPISLAGVEGMSTMAFDERAAEELTRSGTEPAVRANNVVSLLMATRFDAARSDDDARLHSAIRLDPDVDTVSIAALSAALHAGGPLQPATPSTFTDPTPTEDRVSLTTRASDDLRAFVERSELLETRVRSYDLMTAGEDPVVGIWTELLYQTFDRSLDPVDQAMLDESITAGISARIEEIHAPRDRRVVLTSSDTEIPLRFRNDLPVDVHLRLQARSPRLDVSEISEIVLSPGENRIDLPVTVQAPGESLLRIELTSPDGALLIPSSDIPVRSTTISGIGAVLSGVSILFLLGWWLNTVRRSRRNRLRNGGAHPSAQPGPTTVADRG